MTFVAPTVWRKHFGLNGEREKAKKGAIGLCKKLYVDVKNDDEAESYLIALYFPHYRLTRAKSYDILLVSCIFPLLGLRPL